MTQQLGNVRCPLCQTPLRFSLASSRRAKKKKHFVMLVCPTDARHFRGFISDQAFVGKLVAQTEGELAATGTGTEGGEAPQASMHRVVTTEQTERVLP